MARRLETLLIVNVVATSAVLVILVVNLIVVALRSRRTRMHLQSTQKEQVVGTCSASTCGAVDPVSDPDYNMREIAKQTILLEEHLTVPNKYCIDCVAKHLLHCIGLANEAVMLACDNVTDYPYMADAPAFFQGMLDEWLGRKQDAEFRLQMAAELREFRKKLVTVYFSGRNF
jgi:hypothetical protein